MIGRGSYLSNAWLVTGSSLAAVAVLVFFLRILGSPSEEVDFSVPDSGSSKPLRLFCAAGMIKPVTTVIHDYRQEYHHTIQANFAGTGELMNSLAKAGVPGDLFLSADSTTMREAVRDGLVEEVIPIAPIRIVLIVNRKTQEMLKKQGKPVTELKDLLRDDLKKVMLGAEATAIGKVGKTLLQQQRLWDVLEARRKGPGTRVSTHGTVNHVVQTVGQTSGAIGLAWDAVAQQSSSVAIVPLPEDQTLVEHVEIGVLKRSANPRRALHFARYLTARDKGLKHFGRFEFQPVPDADFWENKPVIHLASGAMLKPGLQDVLKSFAKREGVQIDTTYLGCGLLVSQMEAIQSGLNPHRFPDAYASCDIAYAEKVDRYFEAYKVILQNDLVFIVRRGNPKNIQPSLDELKRADLKQIGLPDPKNSALGALVVKLLKDRGFPEEFLDRRKNKRLVNADAAHSLVSQIGSLDVAIVGRSNALANPNRAKDLQVLELGVAGAMATQTFAIAKSSRHKYLMQRLLRAITTPASLQRFHQLGFNIEPKVP